MQLLWLPASTKQDVSIMLAYVITSAGMTDFRPKILILPIAGGWIFFTLHIIHEVI